MEGGYLRIEADDQTTHRRRRKRHPGELARQGSCLAHRQPAQEGAAQDPVHPGSATGGALEEGGLIGEGPGARHAHVDGPELGGEPPGERPVAVARAPRGALVGARGKEHRQLVLHRPFHDRLHRSRQLGAQLAPQRGLVAHLAPAHGWRPSIKCDYAVHGAYSLPVLTHTRLYARLPQAKSTGNGTCLRHGQTLPVLWRPARLSSGSRLSN